MTTRMPRRYSTKLAAGLAALGLCVFTLDGCAPGDYSSCQRGPDHRFDRFKNDGDATVLVGLAEQDVKARFGPPGARFAPEWDMSYWMRPQGLCMDGWYLVLDLDGDGVVRDARVLAD